MGWMMNDKGSQAKAKVEVQLPELEIQLDGEHWIPVNKNCVDMKPNYDGTLEEPVTLTMIAVE